MPRHGNVGVERSVSESHAIHHPAFLLESERLVHADGARVGLSRLELNADDVRKVALDSIEEGSEQGASYTAPLPVGMDGDSQLPQNMCERRRTNRIGVDLAGDGAVARLGNQVHAAMPGGFDKVRYVRNCHLLRRARESAAGPAHRTIQFRNWIDVGSGCVPDARLSLHGCLLRLILHSWRLEM